jgi:sugar fermentation stimulation protein A
MFKNLQKAILIKRYKRFLADVVLENGDSVTIYCPNTGAMTNCAEPGDSIYYSESTNLKRKYRYTWELTLTKAGHWICINSSHANTIIAEALHADEIDVLSGYDCIKAEVKYGNENSRIDFLLTAPEKVDCYVEVKSCTLLDETFSSGQGFFPDAVSIRGQKHLRELMAMKALGYRAVLVFAVLHSGIHSVEAAKHIDEKYALLLEEAQHSGVEIISYFAPITQISND